MRTSFGITLTLFCALLSGCVRTEPSQHRLLESTQQNEPRPWDMFSMYDGVPSTREHRRMASSDCRRYATYLFRLLPAGILEYQICMLQLGFRAPQGELVRAARGPLSGGGCMNAPFDPVCWAEKGGWPQDPPPRWSRPATSRKDLEGDMNLCAMRTPNLRYQDFAFNMDKCMVAKGYTVDHPSSPSMVWPAKSTWPNCAKPESQRNWIEKKWCPPGSAGASPHA